MKNKCLECGKELGPFSGNVVSTEGARAKICDDCLWGETE